MSGKEIWPFLFLIGVLFFNWPFLNIFNLSLPAYLFTVWALLIFAMAFTISKTLSKKSRDDL